MLESPGDDASLWRYLRIALHGVGFSRTSLTVRKHGAIVAFNDILNGKAHTQASFCVNLNQGVNDIIVDLFSGGFKKIDAVKGEQFGWTRVIGMQNTLENMYGLIVRSQFSPEPVHRPFPRRP